MREHAFEFTISDRPGLRLVVAPVRAGTGLYTIELRDAEHRIPITSTPIARSRAVALVAFLRAMAHQITRITGAS